MAFYVMMLNQISTWLSQVGGREVHVVTGACCQPALDARMLMGGIVIDNQVHVKGLGHTGVEMPQRIEELLVTITAFARTQAVPVIGSKAANSVVVTCRT